MCFIPGALIAILTFPGIIVHEFAHKSFCQRVGVPVYEVCYFRCGNPAGYVKHGPVQRYSQAFLIGVAPFIVNSLLAFIIFLFAVNLPEGYMQF